MPTTGFLLRLAALATALVVGPATLAPGTAEAPSSGAPGRAALAGDSTTAAQRYGWRVMQWDFAWEFGESLSSPPYRGASIKGGRWEDASTGTGRAVKYGGGIEFNSGELIDEAPDFGDTSLTLRGKPARLGRWELRERIRQYPQYDGSETTPFTFVAELIPDDPAAYDCGRHNITIARATVGGSSIIVGANAGTVTWNRTLNGYGRAEREGRLYAVQITGRRITWFINGRAVASLAASAAIPKVPMTVRMRVLGQGGKEMKKSHVLIDWVRNYDLTKGSVPPNGYALTQSAYGGDC